MKNITRGSTKAVISMSPPLSPSSQARTKEMMAALRRIRTKIYGVDSPLRQNSAPVFRLTLKCSSHSLTFLDHTLKISRSECKFLGGLCSDLQPLKLKITILLFSVLCSNSMLICIGRLGCHAGGWKGIRRSVLNRLRLLQVLSTLVLVVSCIEIFLYRRCRNITCMNLLPVDDCDCKICSGNKGFCSNCMYLVCLSFDCASNTCSWIGCDVCSHWCHAACGIQRNLIKPGPNLKGPSGTSEMQFHCIGCGHASEMFGFVKHVFMCCAKDWGLETLIKELDCVRRIFRGNEDRKGKELQFKTDDMLLKLQTKMVSPSDACNYIIQFFSCKCLDSALSF
ncbi:Protein OBERON [Sesbania bispinosa]|nr:Protein OBERON [Sesbania bispinosa]